MYYKNVENPDKEICDAFKEELKKAPNKILESMKTNQFKDAMKKGIEGFKNPNADLAADIKAGADAFIADKAEADA